MSNLKNKLIEYGVNFPEVMERFINDEELYFDCIKVFLNDPPFEGLKQAIDNKDYSSAFDHAHTLKGVAANLGLTPLYNAICNIVEPLRNQDYSNLTHQYNEIIKEKDKLEEISEG